MKTILITGGSGHIGSKLIEKLSKNYKVYIIDNFSTNRFSSFFNFKNKITFINEDLLNISSIKIKKIDFIIHLAALTSANDNSSFKNIEKYNFNLTKKVIEITKQTKSKLLFISSTSVYGTQSKLIDESIDLNKLSTNSIYATSKINEEKLIIKSLKKKNFLIFRFGTIFGISKGMRFQTAINKFCYQAVFGHKITFWIENMKLKRPYLGLDDAIYAIEYAIKKDIFKGLIVNILTDNIDLLKIAKVLKKHKKNINFKYIKSPIKNQSDFIVSNKKSINLGFKYRSNLDIEIKKTFNLFKNIKTYEV